MTLTAAFVFDCPTIGNLRRESGGQNTAACATENILGQDSSAKEEGEDAVASAPGDDGDFSPSISTPAMVASLESSVVHVEKEPETPSREAAYSDDENCTSLQPTWAALASRSCNTYTPHGRRRKDQLNIITNQNNLLNGIEQSVIPEAPRSPAIGSHGLTLESTKGP